MSTNRPGAARRESSGRLVLGLALCAALIPAARGQLAAQSSAEPPLAPPSTAEPQAWPEAETVRTLLRADAAAALADCRVPGLCQPATEAGIAKPPSARASDDIRVVAIFGSTRRLSVDLAVNGAMLRYRAGRGEPVAGTVAAHSYQLLAIDDACVRLRRDDVERTACLDAGRAQP